MAARTAAKKAARPTLGEVQDTFRVCQRLFLALGESVRQDIILLLAEAGSLNVNQIAERLPLSRPAISHHLRVLREAGLVVIARRGTENYYSLTVEEAVALLRKFVAQVEASCT